MRDGSVQLPAVRRQGLPDRPPIQHQGTKHQAGRHEPAAEHREPDDQREQAAGQLKLPERGAPGDVRGRGVAPANSAGFGAHAGRVRAVRRGRARRR